MPDGFDPYPLLLLAAGMLTLFVLILRLRVHAFLALIGAALLVGLLSPRVVLQTREMDAYQKLQSTLGSRLAARNVEQSRKVYSERYERNPAGEARSNEARLQLTNAPTLVAQAFGRLMVGIGLTIAFATIIGAALMESGAAERIVRSLTRLFGERFAAVALLAGGFVLGVPVFFDTVFLLMIPLAKALAVRTGRDYLLYVVAIASGASITHALVPPTPGPIGMAELLGVELGTTILVGSLVAAPLAVVGLAYGALLNRVAPVPLRDAANTPAGEAEQPAAKPDAALPSLFASLLPIALPVLLITLATAYQVAVMALPGLKVETEVAGVRVTLAGVLDFLGDKNLSLLLAAVASMVLVARQKRLSRTELGRFTARALDDAGMILLITCAGGAFGAMLTAAGDGDSLGA